MWSKLYLAALGICAAVMSFFTYYSWSWLQSIGQPAAAVTGYEYHAGLACIFLAISGIILLMFANGVLWATHRAWAMWSTFAYVAVFLIVEYFWLGEAFFRYKKANGLFDGSFSLGPVIGVILIVVGAVLVFANQFGSVRLYRKMYPTEQGDALPVSEPTSHSETSSEQ